MKCREIIITIEENIVDLDVVVTKKRAMKPYQVKCVMYDENILAFTDSKDEMIKMRACEMLEKLKEDIMQGVVNL